MIAALGTVSTDYITVSTKSRTLLIVFNQEKGIGSSPGPPALHDETMPKLEANFPV